LRWEKLRNFLIFCCWKASVYFVLCRNTLEKQWLNNTVLTMSDLNNWQLEKWKYLQGLWLVSGTDSKQRYLWNPSSQTSNTAWNLKPDDFGITIANLSWEAETEIQWLCLVAIIRVVLHPSDAVIVPSIATDNRDGSGLVLWARISGSDTETGVIILTWAVSFRESTGNLKSWLWNLH
jgi:hypothetical protein